MTHTANPRAVRSAHLIGLISETHVHVGVGQSSGALDLPVARERTTHFPFIPGSGVKGAMRMWALDPLGKDETKLLFGAEVTDATERDDGASTQAGLLLWSDVRLLLLPVRATTRSFRLVTCPALINRLRRDRRRAGLGTRAPDLVGPPEGKCFSAGDDDWIGLEEREFRHAGPLPEGIVAEVADLVADSFESGALGDRLVVLHDDDFTWFARYGLPVLARNRLGEDKTVKTGALWNEEALAPDTVLYMLLSERKTGVAGRVVELLKDDNSARYVQMGGNETIGQGWLRMTLVEGTP